MPIRWLMPVLKRALCLCCKRFSCVPFWFVTRIWRLKRFHFLRLIKIEINLIINLKIINFLLLQLLEKFNKVCKSYSTEVGSDSEFMNLCQSLQDNALIEIKKSKEIRNAKVTKLWILYFSILIFLYFFCLRFSSAWDWTNKTCAIGLTTRLLCLIF